MNYRHAFHAGNFADVFKHALLTRILLYLMRKPGPIACLDTHAGRGAYDLAGTEAARTGEWRDGVGRLDRAVMPADVEALLRPWFDLACAAPGADPVGTDIKAVASDRGRPARTGRLSNEARWSCEAAPMGGRDARGPPDIYSGSPLVAQRLMRPQDRLVANELHPEDNAALAAALGRDRRVRVSTIDGYAALAAFVPPRERRGAVLIDPPFESADEWARMETALRKAHRKWATGVFALWYPIKEPAAADRFAARFRDGAIADVLRLELMIEATPRRGSHDALALIGCGLLVVNPPWVLESEAAVILPYLAERLGRDAAGSWRCERLDAVPEAAGASGLRAAP